MKIIKHAEEKEIYDAERNYEISRKCIREWIKQKNELEDKVNKRFTYRLDDSGKKLETIDVEPQIVQFIMNMNKEGINVYTSNIIAELIRLKPEYSSKNYNNLKHWCHNFRIRHNLSIRRATHVGQPIPETINDLIFIYLRKIIEMRNKYQINDLNCFINVDETPVYKEMIGPITIAKKGLKSIIINTNGSEKHRISALLSIIRDGNKLLPLLIFRVKKGKTSEKNLQNIQYINEGKIFKKKFH